MTLEYRNGARTAALVFGASGVPIDDPTEAYHEASGYHRSMIGAEAGPFGFASPLTVETEDRLGRPVRRRRGFRVPLPAPAPLDMPLAEAVEKRRSVRSFTGRAGPLEELAAVLLATYGVRSPRPADAAVTPRTVPSAGGRYPLDVIVVPRTVGGLEGGAYAYDPFRSDLVRWKEGDAVSDLREFVTYPDLVDGGAFTLVFVASFRGAAMAATVDPRAAVPATNLVYLVLAYAGGLFQAPGKLPGLVEHASAVLPTGLWRGLLAGAAGPGSFDAGAAAGLAVWAVVFAVAAAAGYRRDEGLQYR